MLRSGLTCQMNAGEVALWRAAEYLREHPTEPSPIRADVIAAQDSMLQQFEACARELHAARVTLVADGQVVRQLEVVL